MDSFFQTLPKMVTIDDWNLISHLYKYFTPVPVTPSCWVGFPSAFDGTARCAATEYVVPEFSVPHCQGKNLIALFSRFTELNCTQHCDKSFAPIPRRDKTTRNVEI